MLACLETFLRGNSNSQAVVWICKQWNFWCHNILWKLALSPGFQIAAPLRKLLRIMSLCQVEKTLFWIVDLEVLLKIYLSNKKKLFCQLSTSYLNCFYPCSCDDEWYFGVTTIFENSQSIKESIPFLESRFSNCGTFKGTFKNHEFIPGGENTVLNCGSGSISENLIIQKKKLFCRLSTLYLNFFILVLVMMSGTLVLQTMF